MHGAAANNESLFSTVPPSLFPTEFSAVPAWNPLLWSLRY